MTSYTRVVVRGLRLVVALALMFSVVPLDVVAAHPTRETQGIPAVRSASAAPTATLDQSSPSAPQNSAPQLSAPQAPDAVGVTATKRDALVVDVDGDTKADPGDTLEYTVVVNNGGSTDATGVAFNDTSDAYTTLGAVAASPVATDDLFPVTVIGNVQIDSASLNTPFSVTDNDYLGQNTVATIGAYDATTAQGGQVVMTTSGANMGKFTYNPPPGYEGSDSFTYTLTDNPNATSAAANRTSTVTLTVSGMIWFINNGAASCTTLAAGCGRLSNPFSTLAAFNTLNTGAGNNPAANDNIFVYESGSAYTGGVTLLSGQKLIGQDSSASLATLTGLAAPTGSLAYPAMNPGAPATTVQNGSGNAVTLNQNNVIRGLTISGTSGAGIIGTSINNLTVGSDVNLTGVSGADLDLSGSASGTVDFGASVNNTTGRASSIQNRTGGTVSFTGPVNDTGGAGILLNSNTGATITFAGGLSLSTGANAAFTATNGGTVNVCDENPCNPAATGALVNTLTTTTGTALNVSNTTIGANSLEFRSISANGATNGIVLDGTGSSGGLVVKGNGGTCTAADTSGCSGGTIQHTTGGDNSSATPGGTAIVLNNTQNVALTRMWIHDNSNYGIRGTGVSGFTLDNSLVNGVNGTNGATPYNDGSVKFDNLTGSAAVSGSNLSGGFNDNFRVVNTSGTLNRITFSNVTFDVNGSTPNNDALSLETLSTAVMNVTVQNSTFNSAAGDLFQLNNNGSGSTDLIFSTNTLINSHPAIATGGGGVTIDGGSVTFHIDHNTFRNAVGHAVLIVKTTDTNTLQGTFDNNIIGAAGTANSGSAEGDGLKVQSAGGGTVTIAITNNQIHQYNNFGIELLTGGSATAQSGNFNATITGNLIDTPGNTAGTIGLPKNGIHLNGGTVPGDTYSICTAISGNSIATSGKDAVPATVGDIDFRLRQRQTTTVRLPGYGGANNDNTAVQNFIIANNSGNGAPVGLASNTVPTGGGFVGGAACTQPTAMLAPDRELVKSDQGVNDLVMAQVRSLDFVATGYRGDSKPLFSPRFDPALHPSGAPQTDRAAAINRVNDSITPVIIGTLPAGKSVTIKFQALINNPVPDGVTQVSNQGTVSGSNFTSVVTDDPDTAAPNDPTVTPLDINADIQLLSKSDGGISVTPGQQFGYTLVYTNAGPQAAANVVLTETVPANTTYTGAGWTCTPDNTAGSVCVINVGNVAKNAGGSTVFTITVINPVPTGVTQLSNSASIGTSVTDPVPGNNTASDTTPVTAEPDLALTKTDGGASVAPGGTVAYALNYSNVGNQGATGVVLTETVPANTTFNAGASSPGWTCTPNNSAGSVCTLTVGNVNGGGASGSRTFAVTVINLVAAGVTQISNTASVGDDGSNGADPNAANNSSTDATPLNAAPDLSITKTDSGISTTPGSTVPYTLAYANVGNQGATGVVLTETVPANTTFNAGASTAGWSCTPDNTAGSACSLAIGALSGGGANGSATFAVTVVNPVTAGVTQISNTASVADDGSNGADPTPGNNSSTDTTPVTAAPDLTLTKSDGGVRGAPNGTVAYTLQFNNTGNQGATSVTLTDTVPADTTFNSSASSAGWSCANGALSGTVCSLVVGGVIGGGTGSRLFAVTVDSPFPLSESAITNTATIADDGVNGADATPANNLASDSTPIDTVPDLQITKTHTGNFTKGQVGATYTLHVSNVGGLPTTGTVTMTDALPIGLTATGLSGSGWLCDLGTLTCTRSDVLNASASYPDITLTVDVAVNTSSTVTNTATVSGGGESNTANDTANDVTSINQAASTTALTSGPNPSVFGQSVIFTATVTAAVGTPTGIVTFTSGVVTLGTGSLSGGVATFSTSSLAVGTHTITATYGGNADFNASSASTTQIVNRANSATVLASNPNPAVFGQSVTFTATVSASAPGAGIPTGVVTFTEGAVVLGSGPLSNGVATFSTSSLAVGAHNITATYSGDGDFNASNGATTQTVNRANTTATLTSAPDPSVFGQAVIFTATVIASAPGAGTPTGVVTFTEGATTLGTGNLNASGLATLSTTSLSVGVHTIVATYGGDSNFTTSNGSTAQTVNQASTSTALNSTPNPAVFGQAVTFTATVTSVAPGAGTASGSVNFYANGALLGSGTLNSGLATFTTASLLVGTQPITATYTGGTSFTGSTSSILNQVINQAGTTTALASAPNPSIYGQSVTFTATVSASAPGAGTPSGSVTFFNNGVSLGTSALNGGVVTLTTASLTAGTHAITATYAGNTSFVGSASSSLSQVVNQANSTTALTSAPNPSSFGQAVTLTATVTSSGGTPSGSVVFHDGATLLGTVSLSGGVATLTTSSFAAGLHSLSAQSSGDANFVGSTSPTVTQVVDKATATVTLGGLNQMYDGTPRPITATTNPIGLVVTFTYDGGSTPPVNAGSYAVVGTISDANYAGDNSGTLLVAQAPLTVTANNAGKIYGDANPPLSVAYAGFQGSDNASSLTIQPTATTTATVTTSVGAYVITPGGGVSINYAFTYLTGTLTISTAPLTVTADNQSRTYGAANPTLTVSYAGFKGSDNATSLSAQPIATTTATVLSPIGNYAVTASGGASNNYTFTYVPGTLTITRAPLTATADDQTRFYGAANPTLTVSYNGFVNSETQTVLSGGPVLTTSADVNSQVGAYPITITAGTLTATNYAFNFVNGTLHVVDTPITSVSAVNDSPTVIGASTTFTATGTGTNLQFNWQFGDGATASGNPVTHTYLAIGTYPVTVTVSNSADSVSATTQAKIDRSYLYLPFVTNRYAAAPDLIVQRIMAAANTVEIVIKNQGDRPVTDEFWVDVYVNPTTPPTAVNQTWPALGSQGLIWGITSVAFPALMPGGVLTLTVNDTYFWPSLSHVSWPLPAGTPVYAQVDSADATTTYGAVLENHEIAGGAYNNILGPVFSTNTSVSQTPQLPLVTHWPVSPFYRWPLRPQSTDRSK